MLADATRPSCWDGIVDPEADYSSHVTYPIDSENGHICSPDFPNKFMTVQFETNFDVGEFPFNGPGEVSWVLANGDTTGVSFISLHSLTHRYWL